jgi:hypothetical protein
MKRLFDLRFVIGIFFLVVGVLLLIYGSLVSTGDASAINTWCGSLFTGFGLVMTLLSLKKPVS